MAKHSPSDLRAIAQFKTALDILDGSETAIRELVESALMDTSGPANMSKKNMVEAAVQSCLAQYAQVRGEAFKKAFRYLRANLE